MKRSPYIPTDDEWGDCYAMLCGHCEHQLQCEVVERMIEISEGGMWPAIKARAAR